MIALLWLKFLVKALVLPPNGPLLVAIVGLALAGRAPRLGRRIAWAGVLVLLVLSMPAVGTLLTRGLDRTPALDPTKASDAQAIVILGGGVRRYASEYRGPALGGITLERVRYGAYLARATGLPLLVSGGAAADMPAEAPLMRKALTEEYGVPVRWIESKARNTRENAVNSAALLAASGVRRVILVGHSFDFPRTRREFEAAGLSVVAAPIGVPSPEPPTVLDFIPSLAGLQRSYFASYELLANALYWMTR